MSFVFSSQVPEGLSDDQRELLQQYKDRRRKQMALFYGSALLTLVSSRLAFRAVKSRKFVPQMFHANNAPPPFSLYGDAVSAAGYASLLATTTFAMGVFGLAWTWDVSSFKEFGQKMKVLLGGDVREKQLRELPEDPETKALKESLAGFLGKKN